VDRWGRCRARPSRSFSHIAGHRQGGGRRRASGASHTRATLVTTLVPGTRREEDGVMRYESAVTSLSWIPSESGGGRGPGSPSIRASPTTTTAAGPAGDVEELRSRIGPLRQRARAWIEVDDSGQINRSGPTRRGPFGVDDGLVGWASAPVPGVRAARPAARTRARGRMGPLRPDHGRPHGDARPRRVKRKPFIQWQAPLAWTTLSLTLHADGQEASTP